MKRLLLGAVMAASLLAGFGMAREADAQFPAPVTFYSNNCAGTFAQGLVANGYTCVQVGATAAGFSNLVPVVYFSNNCATPFNQSLIAAGYTCVQV